MGKSRFPLVRLDYWSASSAKTFVSCFPSTASLMSVIVLSTLRSRVLGLVIVVPNVERRVCPRLKGEKIDPASGLLVVGVIGDTGCDDVSDDEEAVEEIEPFAIAASIAALIPVGDGGSTSISEGVARGESWGSTSSGSTSSGGRRSFSMSDLRLLKI